MALGDFNNKSNQNEKKTPTVYSAYKMNNENSQVDKTAFLPTFCMTKMLKLAIAPLIENGDYPKPDYKNEIAIYITHIKARMLYDEICEFQKDPLMHKSLGINSNNGLITISNGQELGINNPCIIIRKLDKDGQVEASIAYEFKNDYHYAVRNYDESNSEFDKVYYNSLEIEQLKDLLYSYYQAMTGAVAYSVRYELDYNFDNTDKKLDSVCEKLGVKYANNKNNSNNASHSIFNTKNARNSYSNSTIDDIENQIG